MKPDRCAKAVAAVVVAATGVIAVDAAEVVEAAAATINDRIRGVR